MARRRFRSNQRHEPTTERSFQEYILSTPAPQTSRTELLRLIRGGEDTFLELKVKLSNTEKIAQEIVALANTGGGVNWFPAKHLGVRGDYRFIVIRSQNAPLFFGQEATRYAHRVYGAVILTY